MRAFLIAMALLGLTQVGRADRTAGGEAVRFESIVRQNPAQHLFVARIDLTDPRVHVVVAPGGPDPDGPGPWEAVLQPPSVIARTNDLAVAVNGVFFAHTPCDKTGRYAAGAPARAANLVVIDGRTASHARGGAALIVDAAGRASIATLADGPPADARQVIAGSVQIVTAGRDTAGEDGPHARTAAGLTPDGRTLVLLVADGKRPGWGSGLTLHELATEMIAQGCDGAINLDGGGSSTMVARGPDGRTGVVNTPSDGSAFVLPMSIERPVPFVLGVRVSPAR